MIDDTEAKCARDRAETNGRYLCEALEHIRLYKDRFGVLPSGRFLIELYKTRSDHPGFEILLNALRTAEVKEHDNA